MALQTSPPLCLSDIYNECPEHSPTAPHCLSEFADMVGKAPGDAVCMSEFYGASCDPPPEDPP